MIGTWAEQHIWELVGVGVTVGGVWMALVTWWTLRHEDRK